MVCLAAMLAASMSVKAQEVTITLIPGWTWMSCPATEAMDFATALGDFTPMQGDIIKSQWGQATYINGQWRGSLSQFVPGYGYHYKSNRTVPVMVTFNAQQPTSQVVVTTSEPMLITAISAMGGGEVTVTDGTYILVKGLCWATHENPTTNDDFYEEAESGVGSFSISMTDLNISTAYYVRAYAVTPNGTVYGGQKTFTTRDGIPTLTTAEVTDITAITAACGGNITDNGGLNVTARGVCWNTTPNPTISDSHTDNGSGIGSFSSNITGLELGTTYYVRAYATTAVGTAYGVEKTFTTRDGVAVVSTAELINIGLATATSGGTVTDDGGLEVIARGVCWNTISNPTIANSHTIDGTGIGDFSSTLTSLMPNTTYYVRAYATNSHVTVYGSELSFITGNPAYVDLNLPSGTLWATCNVGADTPEGYGDYFAWAETQPKDYYYWNTYQYSNGGYDYGEEEFYPYLTKYYFYNVNYDLTTLLPEDDAAAANWGADWRMPKKDEWQELLDNTTVTWTTQNGVNGRLFTASNGNSLFLPAAGSRSYSSLNYAGSSGRYWSSSLYTDERNAWELRFSSGTPSLGIGGRYCGQSIRPVRCKNSIINVSANPTEGGVVSGGGTYMDHTSCTVSVTANEGYGFVCWIEDGEAISTEPTYTFIVNGNRDLVACLYSYISGAYHYVDLGLPSGTLWATCNVGAENPEDYGNRFAWGETATKDTYDWSTYQYCMGSYNTLTKYSIEFYDWQCECYTNSGYNGFTDDLTTLLPEDDAATANWGSGWRMPTQAEFQELLDNTTSIWGALNGVNGRLFTATNGNSIFMPGAGLYWSSSLGSHPRWASGLAFDSGFAIGCDASWVEDRDFGRPVRPVRSSGQSNIPTGAIDGLFSVSASQQVYFSQGNLQYQASTNTWRFADNQYDYVGSTNSNISSTYTGWIDLFGWGTSGYNHGANCYQPWSTSQTSSDYYAYGSYTYNLYDQTGKADWGYNPISNGGNTANQWRTLTQQEWDYVFNTRTTVSNIRYAKAKVNNVNGVILLPDDWNSSTFSLSSTNTYNASFNSNTITTSQWNTFENAGAVFLPAAGNRNGTEVSNVNTKGFYWTATSDGSSNARNVLINDSSLSSNDSSGCRNGLSVRLVRSAE